MNEGKICWDITEINNYLRPLHLDPWGDIGNEYPTCMENGWENIE